MGQWSAWRMHSRRSENTLTIWCARTSSSATHCSKYVKSFFLLSLYHFFSLFSFFFPPLLCFSCFSLKIYFIVFLSLSLLLFCVCVVATRTGCYCCVQRGTQTRTGRFRVCKNPECKLIRYHRWHKALSRPCHRALCDTGEAHLLLELFQEGTRFRET